MGAPRLERQELSEHADVISYAEAIALLQENTRRRLLANAHRRSRGAYIVNHPKMDEPYATVELDYAGNFSMNDDKDPAQYALDVLGYE